MTTTAGQATPGKEREQVLIVCSANVVRSPLAAALLRRGLARQGHRTVTVISAGLAATSGEAAYAEAQRAAVDQGVDLSQHRALPVTPEGVRAAALVLTMSERQRTYVGRLVPGLVDRTFTLVELCRLLRSDGRRCASVAELARVAHLVRPTTPPSMVEEDVADPVGRSPRHYQRTAEELAGMIDEVLQHLIPGRPGRAG